MNSAQYQKRMASPVGELTIFASDRGVTSIHIGDGPKATIAKVKDAKNHPILSLCAKELREYFEGSRTIFSTPLDLEGTPFQQKTWSVLQRIPYGKVISYGEQAKKLGKSSAVRAVASANGRNPIPIIVPCHRVIASTGHLHGYACGLEIKSQLLEIEGLKIQGLKVIN